MTCFCSPGYDLGLDAGLRQRRLDRLGDIGIGRAVGRIELDLEAIGIAGLGEKLLRLGDIELERRVGQRGKEARRPEGLMDLEPALEETVRHSLIVDQPPNGLAHFRLGQALILLIERQIVEIGLGIILDDEIGIAGDALDLVGGQVAREVGVALLDHQPLRGGLGNMADDDPLDARRAVAIIRIGLEGDGLVGLPGFQHKGTGARRIRLEPCIAEIAVLPRAR